MIKRKGLVVAALSVTLLASSLSGVARADQYAEELFQKDDVSGAAMILDAFFVRPVMAAATVVGGALFVVSAPFAMAGGTTETTWDTFVSTPADNLFIRCLGCTPVQHDQIETDRKMAQSAAEASAP